MQESLSEMSTRLTQKWNMVSKKQQLLFWIGVGILIVTIVCIGIVSITPNMQVIYSNLELKQASDITEVLDGEGIPYKVTQNGRTIQVDKKQATTAKLVLARENVPKGDYTFEDAISNSMATTESEKNAKIHRLKEVNLESALESIEGVSKANVTLVIPKEKNSFIESKQESSASILLTLNASLNKSQVTGIARFIASSVENLKIENINIIDAEGNHLYKGGDSGQLALDNQQELKLSAENEVRKKVVELFGPSFDDIRVSPNLILNFDEYQEAREEYTPQFDFSSKGLIANEQIEQSTQLDGNVNATRDVPTYQLEGLADGASVTSNKTVDYVNNKVVSNLTKHAGEIDLDQSSLAVHVFVDREYKRSEIEPTLGNTTWEDFKLKNKIANKQIAVDANIIVAIQKATGIENIVVQGFENPIFIEDAKVGINKKLDIKEILYIALIIIGIIAIYIIISRGKNKQEDMESLESILAREETRVNAIADEDLLQDIKMKDELETQRLISKFAEEKPEIVTNILRNWLAEEK